LAATGPELDGDGDVVSADFWVVSGDVVLVFLAVVFLGLDFLGLDFLELACLGLDFGTAGAGVVGEVF
jgi:hypothetical protein